MSDASRYAEFMSEGAFDEPPYEDDEEPAKTPLQAAQERCTHLGALLMDEPVCGLCGEPCGPDPRTQERGMTVPDLVDLLVRVSEVLDDYVDVVDGDDGQPRANRAMSVKADVDAALEEIRA